MRLAGEADIRYNYGMNGLLMASSMLVGAGDKAAAVKNPRGLA
jgi:hypothetical protein